VRERLRSKLTYANVMATLAVFIALGGGSTAVALSGSNTVQSDDLGPGAQVKAADLAANSVNSGSVFNGSLNDEDVGQGTFVNFQATIGQVVTHVCKLDQITGINAAGDHLLLTPSSSDANPYLEYTIEYNPSQESATLKTCNYSDTTQQDGTTHFNLLVFDAH
jgi:hypothetical protein